MPETPWYLNTDLGRGGKTCVNVLLMLVVFIVAFLLALILLPFDFYLGAAAIILSLASAAILIFRPGSAQRISVFVRLFIFCPTLVTYLLLFSKYFFGYANLLTISIIILASGLFSLILFREHEEEQ